MTYVLEKIIDMSDFSKDSGEYEHWIDTGYKIKYPDMWDKYILFHRNARQDGTEATMLRYRWNKTHTQINVVASDTLNIYIYRPIVESDVNKGFGINIYNEDGALFYSSSQFPLRIKDIITDLTFGGTLFDKDKPLDYRSGYRGCMVLSYISASVEGSFFSLVFGYGVNNSGNVRRVIDLAALGGGGAYANDIGCIVAYAPDCYPRWEVGKY
ncbi:hypothetical protein GCM10009131_04440 [Morganella psychrotolerans]